jgi:hypothetical protein
MTDYPQDAIDRILGKPGAGAPYPLDCERIYRAAGCFHEAREGYASVARSLARGLEAQRGLETIRSIGDQAWSRDDVSTGFAAQMAMREIVRVLAEVKP